MCGRFSVVTPVEELIKRFEAQVSSDFDGSMFPRFNASPGQMLPVITNEKPDTIVQHKWGLVPFWAKDPAIGFKMINARSETIQEKASFRTSFKKRRCLVLADSFFEWKKTGKDKIPYRIMLKNEEPFAMAGLWEIWKNEKGDEVRTFTIITTSPNKLCEDVHNRMPCILDKKEEKLWIDMQIPEDAAIDMLKSYTEKKMKMYQVSTLVNSAKNNVCEIIQELGK
jgi:putative SOS response-associated peptidase YedK